MWIYAWSGELTQVLGCLGHLVPDSLLYQPYRFQLDACYKVYIFFDTFMWWFCGRQRPAVQEAKYAWIRYGSKIAYFLFMFFLTGDQRSKSRRIQ